MTTVRERLTPGSGDSGAGSEGGAASRWPSWRAGLSRARDLVGHHRIFTVALVLAVIPRVLSIVAYQPAVLFRLDTFDYLWGAVHLSPNVVNPSGYSLFLWLLRPFHSIVLVTVIQHVMGLVVAGLVYAFLRRRGLPSWGATLAAAPVLFDPGQLLLEQFVMADLLALSLMVTSFVVLLWQSRPSFWRSATAGLLMGVSATVRPTTIVFIVLIAVYLLLEHVGWRRAGAALVAGVVPVAAYMVWFAGVNGSFNMTNSNGLFLWSRTMSFARCAIIKPPPSLQPLCPERQPAPLNVVNPADRLLPKNYLWNHDIWAWQPPQPGFVPDAYAFSQANNSKALKFAILAIKREPLSYLHVVALETMKPFHQTKSATLAFPRIQMRSTQLTHQNWAYAIGTVRAYTGSDQGVAPYLGYQFGTRMRWPFVYFVQDYAKYVFLPGQVFALISLAGLVGLLFRRRRTAVALLLWLCAMVAIVLPIAEHEYTYRYVIPAVPLVCIAAALAFRNPAKDPLAGQQAAVPAGAAAGAGPLTEAPAEESIPAEGQLNSQSSGPETAAGSRPPAGTEPA